MRRLVPYALLPLSLIACALASTPWLRAFPASVIALPLFGAAVLSVLVPVIVIGIGVRRLWLTIVLDVAGFVLFAMLVTLREVNGFVDLYDGIVHGPSQILSFALPLISPRTLLVPPIALAWLCGATVGECLARGWQSVLPYATIIATFGLAYGGSARALTDASDGRRYDTLIAAGVLVMILLLRVAHAWVAQDADGADPDGLLPVRSLVVGAAVSVAVALVAAALVQIDAFKGQPDAPVRTAPVNPSRPIDPIAFVAGLRPTDPKSKGTALFSLGVNRQTSNFVAIAAADSYNGDTWSFSDRTFIPSGGVIPADADSRLRPGDAPVVQTYTIRAGPLTQSPWMPFQYRPQQVKGRSVDIDPDTGMIVPSRHLTAGSRYTVWSATTRSPFDRLPSSIVPSSYAPSSDTHVDKVLTQAIDSVIQTLSTATGVSIGYPVPFLQAAVAYLRKNYRLPATLRAGSTGFADVLASILGQPRAGSPEQFATLVALIARRLQVPARIATGFRIPIGPDASSLAPGTYSVSTADAWTWVEIPIDGLGWVALDATPTSVSSVSSPPSPPVSRPGTPSPTVTPGGLITSTSNGGNPVATSGATVSGSRHVTSVLELVIVLAVVVLALALTAFVVLRKRLRARRRRRNGDPRQRLLGAWQESLDVLRESGLDDLTSLTSAEVAAVADERYGHETAEQTRFIGERANLAIFSPSSSIDADTAEDAWRAHHVLRRDVSRRLTVRQRLGAGLRYQRRHARASDVAPDSWEAASRGRRTRPNRGGSRH